MAPDVTDITFSADLVAGGSSVTATCVVGTWPSPDPTSTFKWTKAGMLQSNENAATYMFSPVSGDNGQLLKCEADNGLTDSITETMDVASE